MSEKCYHPTTIEDMESNLHILFASRTGTRHAFNPIEYICYCPECDHIIGLVYYPLDGQLREAEIPNEVEESMKIQYDSTINQWRYKSVW
jgi:hypothetical protein